MNRWLVFLAAFAAALTLNQPGGAVERGFTNKFCISPPNDALCSVLPYDQADFSRDFSYMLIEKGAQDPFDVFAWQAFVALNWPGNAGGSPLDAAIGTEPGALRVWQAYARRDEIMGPDPALQACGHLLSDGHILIGDFEQSDGNVLIDRHGNPAVYSTYANDAVAGLIRRHRLNRADGQAAYSQSHPIAFPKGRLADPVSGTEGTIPSVTLKMAWRLLPAEDVTAGRYFTRHGIVHIPAKRGNDGDARCQPVTLGLVGMHIAMRTSSGNGNEWIWATFEHTDNAPVAANARDVNSIYADDLFPGGCTTPVQPEARSYSFFDATCKDCRTNTPMVSGWRWSNDPPHARRSNGRAAKASQAVRCWKIFESTAAVNALWAEKLKGTVWANYMLISTQWRGAEKSPLFEHGEVPRYLTNVSLETYQQAANNGTCLGCHASARTASGAPADFVFMLQRAH